MQPNRFATLPGKMVAYDAAYFVFTCSGTICLHV